MYLPRYIYTYLKKKIIIIGQFEKKKSDALNQDFQEYICLLFDAKSN